MQISELLNNYGYNTNYPFTHKPKSVCRRLSDCSLYLFLSPFYHQVFFILPIQSLINVKPSNVGKKKTPIIAGGQHD